MKETLREYYKRQNTEWGFLRSHREDEIAKIRTALRNDPDVVIDMRMWNEIDADLLRERLTPEELKRVHFRWIVFT